MAVPDQIEQLGAVLVSLESSSKACDEIDLAKPLGLLARQIRETGASLAPEIEYEQLAFSLWENQRGAKNPGDRSYGTAQQLDPVLDETIDYWERRAHECPRPIMRFRYADLVWELSSQV